MLRLQVMAISGERSRYAQPMPVARLVAPGPSVAMQSPGRAGDAPGNVGGKAGGALVRGEHEIDAAPAHRLHQRQHVAARNAEAAPDAGRLQRGDDQVGIVHGLLRRCCMGRALWHTSEPPIKLLRSARLGLGRTIDR